MIYTHELSAEIKSRSRLNLNIFNSINGFSYMCLGETVIILFAVKLNAPNYVISLLGAMIYFGFLLLPLGRYVAGRVGAARCQANFWVMRNIAALLVASAAPVSIFISRGAALVMILIGAFSFYGFRAAGIVMGNPLMGDICEEDKRAKFILLNGMLFNLSGLLALITVVLLLRWSESVWMLCAIIVMGASAGVTSSKYIRRIDETDRLKKSATRPILPEVKLLLKKSVVTRQLMAGFAINLSIILTVPISMLALKRGCGVNDVHALLYSIIQFAGSIAAGLGMGKFVSKVGPRRRALVGFSLYLIIALFWVFFRGDKNSWLLCIPFLLAGTAGMITGPAMQHYFLMSIPVENQVASSMMLAICTGAGAGIVGMVLGPLLLALAGGNAVAGGMELYRRYFFLVFFVVLFLGIFVKRLVKVIDTFREEYGEEAVKRVAESSPLPSPRSKNMLHP